jgi:hypothetical protein
MSATELGEESETKSDSENLPIPRSQSLQNQWISPLKVGKIKRTYAEIVEFELKVRVGSKTFKKQRLEPKEHTERGHRCEEVDAERKEPETRKTDCSTQTRELMIASASGETERNPVLFKQPVQKGLKGRFAGAFQIIQDMQQSAERREIPRPKRKSRFAL